MATTATPAKLTPAELLERVYPFLLLLAGRYAYRHRIDRAELVQAVAVKFLEYAPNFPQHLYRPTTFLNTVFRSIAPRHLHAIRQQQRRFVPHPDDCDRIETLTARTEAPPLAAVDRAAIRAAVEKLPRKQRRAVVAKFWRGEVQQRFAARTRTSRQAVSQRERYALKALAWSLAAFDEE